MTDPPPGRASELDCRACAACCRGAFEIVSIPPQARVIAKHPELVRFRDGCFELGRRDDRCVALERTSAAPEAWACRIYDDRPQACRVFEAGSDRCLAARERTASSS